MEERMPVSKRQVNRNGRPYWHVIVSLVFSLTFTVLFIYAGVKMIFYFMPFVIGWFISFIVNPIVVWLEKRLKIVKKLSSAIIIILVLGVIVVLIYLALNKIIAEVSGLIQSFPELYGELEEGLRGIGTRLDGVFNMLPKGIQEGWSVMVQNMDQRAGEFIGNLSQPTVVAAGNFAKRIPSVLVATIVMIVSAYFFIAQREEVISWSKAIAPDGIQRRMTMVIDNLKYAVGGYFKAQFKIMAVVGVLLLAGFAVLQVNYAILLAFLIAFLDFLPFFGTGTALIPWALYKVFVGNYQMAFGLAVIYLVTQLVRQIIQPKLVGDSVGMNPLITLILLYVGYKVGSLFGMILAVPVGMIVMNLYKAGAFDYILDDVRILINGVLSLRGDHESK